MALKPIVAAADNPELKKALATRLAELEGGPKPQ